MTEKRFISKNESIINVATDELVNASCEESAEILVDWLNELKNVNAVLTQGILTKEEIINDLKDDINKCNIQCRKLGNENEQLKSENIELTVDNKELKCTNNELYQENKQLKKEIEELK